MKSLLSIVLVIMLCGVAHAARGGGGAATIIPKSVPLYPVLVAKSVAMTEPYANTDQGVFLDEWEWLDSASIKALFPKLRFAFITWEAGARDLSLGSRAGGFGMTVAIDTASRKIIMEIGTYRSTYESFSSMLNTQHVLLRNTDDAKKLWEAFCEISRRTPSIDLPLKKISDSEWHLGMTSIVAPRPGVPFSRSSLVDMDFYFNVVVDSKTGQVVSWKPTQLEKLPSTLPAK